MKVSFMAPVGPNGAPESMTIDVTDPEVIAALEATRKGSAGFSVGAKLSKSSFGPEGLIPSESVKAAAQESEARYQRTRAELREKYGPREA